MNESPILAFINQNPWINIIFYCLTTISIPLMIYFYFKSKKNKKPTYAIRTVNLVKEKIKKIKSVEIYYKGQFIDNISVTKIAIWNAGKDTISKTDIAENDLFRIEISKKFKILDCEILTENNTANGFGLIKKSENKLLINFDYFDRNEGIVLQIYHTAPDSKSLEILGSFKGTESIIRKDSSDILPSFITKVFISKIITPKIMRLILIPLSFFVPMTLWFIVLKEGILNNEFLFGNILLLAGLILITFVYWYLGIQLTKRRVPRSFNSFEEEFK